jgi:CshA-type fibril repeat protein
VSTTFVWTVTNPAPVAVDDTATTAEDTPVTIGVLANDSDPDGDVLTVTSASAANGTVSINPDGTITYTPDANFNGTDTITYQISDGNGGIATATVTVTVTPANDAPVATPLPALANPDGDTVSLDVSGAFSDPDGDTLSFAASGLPAGLSIDPATGVISGTIDPAASQGGVGGVYTVTVTADDGNGGTVSTTFVWTVTNPAPVAVDDTATTAEDTPVTIGVLANDSDPDGDVLTVTSAIAANGTVAINPDGSLSYTPDPDFNGTDTITYQISDGNGGIATATVTVTVTPANDAPVAVDDTAVTDEDAPVTIPVLANDSDPDGDPLTVTAATAPNGTVTINPDGTITYTPNPDFNGTDTITYTVSDGNGGTTTATVTVTVNPVNDAPAAIDDVATTNEDTPVAIAVLANDSDLDGDTLVVTAASSPDGTVTINADGSILFTPDPDFNGTTTVSYTISDGKGGTATATVTVTVAPVNDPPLAVNDTATTNEDTPVTIPALANDSDADGDPLTVIGAAAANGTVTINPDGTITYTPDPDFNGTDTITYTVSDGNGGLATATITVTVAPVNDPPVVAGETATTREDTPVTIPVLANDSDPDGDPLTVTAASAPNGTVTINPDGTITYTPNPDFSGTDTITYTVSDGRGGFVTATVTVTVTPVNDPPVAANDTASTNEDTPVTIAPLVNDSDVDGGPLSIATATAVNGRVTINPDGTITYTPNANFNGIDTITYAVGDGNGGFDTATITVTVAPVNDPPIALPDAATINQNTPTVINVLANDRDIEGDPLTVTAASAANGSVVVNADGTITYTPAVNFTGTDTITYTVSDGRGGFTTTTVTVTVLFVPDAPDVNFLLGNAFGVDVSQQRLTPAGPVDDTFINAPLVVLDTANGLRSLGGTTGLNVPLPVLAAVNGIDSLDGIGGFDIDGSPVSDEVARLDRLATLGEAGDRVFQPRFGDFVVKGFSGFSVRQTSGPAGQIMVDSVVRDRTIYVEMRDVGGERTSPIREFQLRSATDGALPDWIRMDARGLAIIERPVDVDTIRLIIRGVREDGRVIEVPVNIQGATGEIQLDGRQILSARSDGADLLGTTMMAAKGAADAEAARLAAAFGD